MKFLDIHMADFLAGAKGKGTFDEFALRKTNYEWDMTTSSKIQLLEMVRSEFTDQGETILSLEMNLLPILSEMELYGVRVDKKKLEQIGQEIRKKIQNLEGEIYEVVGDRFNIASPKQIQELFTRLGIPLTKKNKTGYSVDTEVLEEIAKTYDIARLILEHRLLSKLESTYIVGLTREIDASSRIHTTYNQMGSSTGRLSSEDPNLQNIPTGVGYGQMIKSCFIPSGNDHILLVADYSQIELRVLAFLSGDGELIDTFDRKEDIHTRTGKFIFGENTEITSERRRIAKSVNFGVIYGITGFGLSKMISTSPAEATKYIEAFFTRYPGVRSYYDTLLENGRKNGYVETYFGRRRYIPGLADANKTMRAIAEREAINMPVQGTAADIIKLAMLDIDANIRDKGLTGKMMLQVHDELVFDIPISEEEEFTRMVRDSMEGVLEKYHHLGEKPTVDLIVDIHSGKDWASAKN